jgi:HK97 gp10 family phage protein
VTIETVEVKGLRELREALVKKIPAEMQGKVLQSALAAGARPIVADAKARAPKKTGTLRRSLFSFRVKSASTGTREERAIRPRQGKKFQKAGRDAFYWRFVEFGTAKMPAQPFLRPAFESKKQDALAAIVKQLGVAIEKAARKAAWHTSR